MIKNITNVRGIKCWGAHTGVKSMRRDLAIIYSEVPAAAAAVFTQNKVRAEPVEISERNVSNLQAQVIVCNAGNANACTGEQGRAGAEAMMKVTAELLNIPEDDVIIASTGLIGEPFPTNDVVNGIRENIHKLSDDPKAGSFVANAILTTDTFAKEGFVEFEYDGKTINMGGVAKGSGMIHPNMATMLNFIVTDLNIEKPLLDKALRYCVDRTFNMITVDGDTSTNDMVAILANGMADNKKISDESDPGYRLFRDKLLELMTHLAKLIVSDGEGASKFIEYKVTKARTEEIARKLVRAISDSTLVKTAMFGRDPNWGRIIAACGNSGVNFTYKKVNLFIGDAEHLVQVLEKGQPLPIDKNYIKKLLRESQIRIILEVNTGKEEGVGWGSDLTTDYVLFNSVYTT
ncbi:bifunctional glutamate N-acetyltransferase/amino-acid acetyltransferase ArgJ [Belliella kenyensis]|uniref:Arginine biosynthesis bifunctional protein ArgJ n=1 Tax=Belliella kenyensis TaxID=1472724 RepID=A0ABV8ELS7_9BACT|nr:bifunctional glutamate N-acetyltransferase/amino-acid acetyltransferase ArgJ [Belliella kenyensis]MCH7401234.1 bifunctional glutamate N-acetyltransferase/amino-acid acetyltransferase ArgJ [Belliella kenyensis]MDN3602680.1 bifunctional glutamate N-acetyltransferase/amino-acid acetyltransferase ArgJ [Belliella kenyensis]